MDFGKYEQVPEQSDAESTAQPAEIRRAIRMTAATNTKKAIIRQFPGILAATAVATSVSDPQKKEEDGGNDKKTV
jgi:hypothetical protein